MLAAIAAIGVASIAWAMMHARPANTAIIVPQRAPMPGEARPAGYILGSAQAPVEIVEYADFECPACETFSTVTEPDVRRRLIDTGVARYRFYDFQVVPQHHNSPAASLAAACADEQGKFWPMHDRLFGGQNDWSTETTDNPRPVFESYAKTLGLDVARWGQCYDGRKYLARLAAHRDEAVRAKVTGTPTFVIGDRLFVGALSFDALKAAVDSVRLAAPAARP